ncbi:hypothetical protein [Hydrogenophaga laconesensis]|uniref:Uncharacterized protein n=1 Tax=Hydrogenophaga laconesensis TaxID=1805971 RepID=A0ABU1VHX2_9BURK|nr:hypothetical protein [Hydrogenophaga laconesensis]MDR7097081.1 hypothetical protein [Hydrogenophaga laconesensis]
MPAAPSARKDKPSRPDGRSHGDPENPVQRSPRAPGSSPASEADEHLELPHERDQSTKTTASAPDRGMRQAQKDLEAGQVDTDMRVTPGLDAEQRARYVPGAGGRAPSRSTDAPSPAAPRKGPRP